jgi:cytochrome c-type biogenesis protein CcmH/NrfG
MLSNDPSDLKALVALGQCLLDDRRAEEAIQAFERVLAFDDENVPARFFVGVALGRLRRYRAAVMAWEQVIALQPDGPFAREARKHVRSARDLHHIFHAEKG